VLEPYLQGSYYLTRGSGDAAMKEAQEFFQQAIDGNPGFAPAYVGLAYSHYFLLRSSPEDRIARRTAAEKAVTSDPSSSDAHSALASMKFADWDWPGAEK
jgi:hypothetical protein